MMPYPRLHFALALIAVGLIADRAYADAPKRHPVDASDIVRMAAEKPRARSLFDEGEALLEKGDVVQAAACFETAAEEAPHSALAARRACQALLEMAERDRAILACRRAIQREGSPLDLRALARAILAKQAPLTFDELNEVTAMAARAQRSMPRQPWGYAITCDIAKHLGDAAMLDACKKSLERVAPDHAETKRAFAMALPAASDLGIAFGWGAIVFASVATLVDLARRRSRRALSVHRTPQRSVET